jgi:predicted lipoprotein
MPKTLSWPILAAAAALVLAGCKILPTPPKGEGGGAAPAFDPDKMAAEMWATKVLPYLEQKAGPFAEVSALAKNDPAAAGAKYGNPRKQANSPWTYAVTLEGRIVASNTQSRNGTVDVDLDGDAKADVRVQIGPAIQGTAIRDTLDFVNFNDFTNQIDFAQFGKALNTHANQTVLSKLPRDTLEGRTVKALGAYAIGATSGLAVVTPAEAEIGPAP